VYWIDVAQNRDLWLAVVKTVMKDTFHDMETISRLAEEILASKESLYHILPHFGF
jgi:hypothetical protein